MAKLLQQFSGEFPQAHDVQNQIDEILTNTNGENIPIGAEVDIQAIKQTIGFRAQLSANQENLSSDNWHTVLFDTDVFDYGSGFDTANNKFVAPAAGMYFLGAHLYWNPAVADKRYLCGIYNGGTRLYMSSDHNTSTNYIISNTGGIAVLSEGDEITVQAYHNDGVGTSDIFSDAETNFFGYYIGSV